MNHYVEVVDQESKEVVKKMGPMSVSKAIKVEAGIEINLDHDKYFTRVVSCSAEENDE